MRTAGEQLQETPVLDRHQLQKTWFSHIRSTGCARSPATAATHDAVTSGWCGCSRCRSSRPSRRHSRSPGRPGSRSAPRTSRIARRGPDGPAGVRRRARRARRDAGQSATPSTTAHFGGTDDVVAAKVTRRASAGLTPVLCVGETEHSAHAPPTRSGPRSTAPSPVPRGRPRRPLVVAYEPVLGDRRPGAGAGRPHVRAVGSALRTHHLAGAAGRSAVDSVCSRLFNLSNT
ncbi:hypothetical protein HBB16_12115, partial [Pseudonocardia sp. MCCB 268]|nr:hypothetical protein [Pseudonocardia cytotoxica]